ncbi:alpha/beta fold hydrolase [Pseudooceanicola nanhaiensis]|uniref:alpha/beta fold hydrolase n=1 Tax=Pseudooceanicola nanhaiensis TaxID=375761 RepID=UPI001CD7DE5D|nr:alpha/beta fold hydrolase [Pseudooceanicola nanhaiensis]MCA0921902.1 alpha/beta fold hydrolase [Pseudooceanicola nanhaiensis]
MARFVLIHGACHDGRCWHRVIPELEARGHAAIAPDLPGRGADPRPHGTLTLDDYAEAVLAATEGPTILVGHSAGGFAISRAAELAPQKVQRLVYLCAFLPRDGASLTGMTEGWPRAPLKGIARRHGDSYAVDPALDDLRFYQDVAPDLRRAAQATLVPEPMAPHAEPIRLGTNWQNTPRSYIRCTKDLTIDPARQAEMAADCDPKDRYDMPTGHSPFLSDPRGLAALLHQIAGGR